jgi:ribulose kinase
MSYTLGIDYGTNSVRALVVRCADGAELGTCVVEYPSGQQVCCSTRATITWRGSIPATTSTVWSAA